MFLNDTSRTSSAVESRVVRCWSNICYISDIRTTRPTLFWIAKFFHKRFSHSWLDGKNQENYDSFTVIQNLEFHLKIAGRKQGTYSNLLFRWKIFLHCYINRFFGVQGIPTLPTPRFKILDSLLVHFQRFRWHWRNS